MLIFLKGCSVLMKISVLDADRAVDHCDALCELLKGSVEGGAVIGFVLPFGHDQAKTYWGGVLQSMADGERVLICALDGERLIGTVQLYLSPETNAPHRAEVFKLLVYPGFQRQGIGAALMQAAEDEARRRKRSLLLLDTVAGGAGERLYRRLGWLEIGTVPNHFVDPHGNPKSSIYFMRQLD
jgi:ribosomal protein S18 acetylase RimI-like enzyme